MFFYPLTEMTQLLMIFKSVICQIILSQLSISPPSICLFLQTYHSLREITDPSMWDT